MSCLRESYLSRLGMKTRLKTQWKQKEERKSSKHVDMRFAYVFLFKIMGEDFMQRKR